MPSYRLSVKYIYYILIYLFSSLTLLHNHIHYGLSDQMKAKHSYTPHINIFIMTEK